ncbi:hypothetical protein [Phytopseudomonas flavescens]|nr:hypothetical protein [Pseudomonas flavescens]
MKENSRRDEDGARQQPERYTLGAVAMASQAASPHDSDSTGVRV